MNSAFFQSAFWGISVNIYSEEKAMSSDQVQNGVGKMWSHLKQNTFDYFPQILGFIAIILIGYIIARMLRTVSGRALKHVGRFIPSRKIRDRLHPAKLEPWANIISNVLFWVVICFFFTAATETLGLPIVSTWLSGIANYLPNILVAVGICVVGIIGGILLRDAIVSISVSAGIGYGDAVGRIAQYLIILLSIIIGIDQIGVDITFLTGMLLILMGTLLFGAALAFGLGAQTVVGNILASHYLQKTYKIGNRVKINNIEGRITQFTPTGVILETPEGHVHEPASHFEEMASILTHKEK